MIISSINIDNQIVSSDVNLNLQNNIYVCISWSYDFDCVCYDCLYVYE